MRISRADVTRRHARSHSLGWTVGYHTVDWLLTSAWYAVLGVALGGLLLGLAHAVALVGA